MGNCVRRPRKMGGAVAPEKGEGRGREKEGKSGKKEEKRSKREKKKKKREEGDISNGLWAKIG